MSENMSKKEEKKTVYNYKTQGKLKVLNDYTTDPKEPNWYFIINDMKNTDHRGYTKYDMSKFAQELKDLGPNESLLVQAKGESAVHKSGKNAGKNFISKAIVSGWLEDDDEPEVENIQDDEPEVKNQVKSNGQTKYVTNSTLNQDGQKDVSYTDLLKIYEDCWQTVNSSELLRVLSESDRKDISTSLFIFKTRRM